LLGHGAADVIHTFAFAIRFGLTAKDLKDFIYAYPTNTSDVRFLV
jgi:glutathione reductase (NADPH)